MKITEAAKKVGLTQKAIRLYEKKGLLSVSRMENGYRDYSSEDLQRLRVLKLLRTAGVALSDIKLYIFGVCTLKEIIDKQKAEIIRENGKNSDRYSYCEEIENKITSGVWEEENRVVFSENERSSRENHGPLAVGIDIGTTTVSLAVIDIEKRKQIDVYSLFHNADIEKGSYYSEQSTKIILDKAIRLLEHIRASYENIISIGITGQMHGIVYYDKKGDPVSDLINWQDKRGDAPVFEGRSAAQEIKRLTGAYSPTGYGITSHFYNQSFSKIPKDAVGFASIMDILAMKLCAKSKAISHSSVAHSFGLFDLENNRFCNDLLIKLCIDAKFLPDVTDESVILGIWNGIPVSVAIGDNQAAFLGSVKNHEKGLLVNIGTGAQISAEASCKSETGDGIEIRPLIEGKYIASGSSLCGGSAYAMLEEFFRSYATALGLKDAPQYSLINSLGENAYENKQTPMTVDTSFLGTRTDPDKRGSISMISKDNFTPQGLILGVICGICKELYELYLDTGVKKELVIASGGAVRKNKILRNLIEDTFGLPLILSNIKEEAATGAALFGALAAGKITFSDGFSDFLGYDQEDI